MTTKHRNSTILTEWNGHPHVSDLICPCCGENYLHSRKVVVFDRTEDADMVTRTTAEGPNSRIEMVPNSSDNPSARRHGIVISFWCEICTSEPQLEIAQHKGNTHIGWWFTDGRTET